MNWEIGMDIYTVLCVKEITNESLLYSTGGEVQSVYRTCIKLTLKCIPTYSRYRQILFDSTCTRYLE